MPLPCPSSLPVVTGSSHPGHLCIPDCLCVPVALPLSLFSSPLTALSSYRGAWPVSGARFPEWKVALSREALAQVHGLEIAISSSRFSGPGVLGTRACPVLANDLRRGHIFRPARFSRRQTLDSQQCSGRPQPGLHLQVTRCLACLAAPDLYCCLDMIADSLGP